MAGAKLKIDNTKHLPRATGSPILVPSYLLGWPIRMQGMLHLARPPQGTSHNFIINTNIKQLEIFCL